MDLSSFYDSQLFALVVLPLLIFLARVIDVSLGTIRIIFVSHGQKILAPILGFFEILIWLLAISQIMQNLTNPLYYLAFASGFSVGNFVGIYLEEKLAIGTSIIQVITQKDATELVGHLKSEGCGITSIDAQGSRGPVKIIYAVVNRKNIRPIVEIIKKCNPNAFFLVEAVRSISKAVLPVKSYRQQGFFNFLHSKRK